MDTMLQCYRFNKNLSKLYIYANVIVSGIVYAELWKLFLYRICGI